MQQPTLTNVHIRSVEDAHKLFYAVQQGLLPKIEKRLDAHERNALRPGNVYVWEEKGPSTDNFTVNMERFTEGRSWTASRVRDEFLMYFESTKKKKGDPTDSSQRARLAENQVVREGDRDQYIKLTYSVYRNDLEQTPSQAVDGDKEKKKARKWHLNAYFTKSTEGRLGSIDDYPFLRDLVVPEDIFRSARTSKGNKRGDGSKSSASSVQRTYAPFPSSHPRAQKASMSRASMPKPEESMDVDVSALPPQPGPSHFQQTAIPQDHHQQYPNSLPGHSLQPPISSTPVSLYSLNDRSAYSHQQDSASLPPQFVPYPSQAHAQLHSLTTYGVDPAFVAATASAHVAGHLRLGNGGGPSKSIPSPSPPLSDYSNMSWSPAISPVSSSGHRRRSSGSPTFLASPLSSASSSQHSFSHRDASVMEMQVDHAMTFSPVRLAMVPRHGQETDSDGSDGNASHRVALVPLQSLERSHPYRRSPIDDRALRLLGPGTR